MFFADLSSYSYFQASDGVTQNVGWLAASHSFRTGDVHESLLEKLWAHCKISVMQTRGFHSCEFCPPRPVEQFLLAERHGERLLLGTSEIRVFGMEEAVFAAPTMIYHYVVDHHYQPPDEFLVALGAGPTPPNADYFERLRERQIEWRATSVPNANTFKYA